MKNSEFEVADCILFTAFCYGHGVQIGCVYVYLWFINDAIGSDYDFVKFQRMVRWYHNFKVCSELRQRYIYFDLFMKGLYNLNGYPVSAYHSF